MARLENGSYDEIVVHLASELELIALEESDDFPQHLSPKTFSPMVYLPKSSGTITRKKDKGSKTAKNSKKERERCPKRQTNSEANLP